MKNYFLARLKEPSTWRGVVLILAASGANLSPDWQNAIITLGMALSGGIAVTTKG